MTPTLAHRLTHGEREILTAKRPRYAPLDPVAAKETLFLVKEAFDRHQIPFWLVCGTLLGAYQHGSFIATDKDIDLGCFEKDGERIYLAVLDLQALGFEVVRTSADDTYFQLRYKSVLIDFCAFAPYRGTWRSDTYYETEDWFSELKEYAFLGTTFLIPARTEDYLNHRYPPGKAHKVIHRIRR